MLSRRTPLVKKLSPHNPYEFFSVSADIIVFRCKEKRVELLLIQRKNPPYKGYWALPGGFVDKTEDTITAAKRELYEETGLKCHNLTEFGSFSQPNRDPRGRVLTVSYFTTVKWNSAATAADDAMAAKWFSVNKLPRLAFDHKLMIKVGLEHFYRSQSMPSLSSRSNEISVPI